MDFKSEYSQSSFCVLIKVSCSDSAYQLSILFYIFSVNKLAPSTRAAQTPRKKVTAVFELWIWCCENLGDEMTIIAADFLLNCECLGLYHLVNQYGGREARIICTLFRSTSLIVSIGDQARTHQQQLLEASVLFSWPNCSS